MKRDVDYVVKDGEIIIVDEFTGRLMFGRRYSEGLHQAIEAKEHVDVQRENKTLATITFQNFFRLYTKLSGMTGTALTEEEEFGTIYNLDIVEIPTNKPLARIDNPDVVYKSEIGKNRAIINQIIACHEKGQPVLVGTISIEKSEYLSSLLKKEGIKHNVLNAKQHDREAEIIAQAGKFGAVTISTNMAGRGTDIVLGGNAEFLARADLRKAGYDEDVISEAIGHADTDNETVLEARELFNKSMEKHSAATAEEAEKVRAAGGLYVLGTERHESRRIDNQLRGRSGRQGDPGETRFFLAMTDDIMRLFGSEKVLGMMDSVGIDDDTPIDQKILSNAIETAQKKVESRNFQSRKRVLEYDDVMNTQREVIYDQRRRVLDGEDITSNIQQMIDDVISSAVSTDITGATADEASLREAEKPFIGLFLKNDDKSNIPENVNSMTAADVTEMLSEKAHKVYEFREREFGNIPGTDTPIMRELERIVLLRVVDEYWMDHIDAMSDLRQGITLRAYAQTNPVDEYKREGFEMFEAMINGIKEEVVRRIFTVRISKENPLQRKSVSRTAVAGANAGGDSSVKKQPVKVIKKPGRNDPCPCGKWKADGSRPLKYKECCGRNE
jgi:preprotein translocase subunit SecA